MTPLILLDELANYKSRDLIPLTCNYCLSLFYLPKNRLLSIMKDSNPKNTGTFCSHKCAALSTRRRTQLTCITCNALFIRLTCQINKSNNFCSKSCAATYNNQHKAYGTRRSKLEAYLETQIKEYYPDLPCLFNTKEAIGSELDFYFPTLKLAVELNGIFHYEPIYGTDKLDRIQDNDSQKAIRCYELGIEFCSIDASTYSNLTKVVKDKYWSILNVVLHKVINRNLVAWTGYDPANSAVKEQ